MAKFTQTKIKIKNGEVFGKLQIHDHRTISIGSKHRFLFTSLLVLKSFTMFLTRDLIPVLSLLAPSLVTAIPTSRISAPIVTVKNGSYAGVHNSFYNQDFFLGIPYAQVCFSFPLFHLLLSFPSHPSSFLLSYT